ncbi:hypothetical protein ACFLWB_02830 [Chloroflexota bacterium]
MTKETKKLVEAFTTREEISGFMSKLDQLEKDSTITKEQYAATREEYDRRLELNTLEISLIKSALQEQMEARQQDIDICKREYGILEVKHKVDELPLDKYQSYDRKLRDKIDKLEADANALKRLIEANSIADIGVPAEISGITVPQLQSITKIAASAKQIKLPQVRRPELSSLAKVAGPLKKITLPRFSRLALVVGVLLLISVFLPWIAASEAMGAGLGSVPGKDVSDIIGRVGIFGALIIIGTAFLPVPKLRGVLQTLIGLGALLALPYIILTGDMPLLNEHFRELIVIRQGLYLYGLVAVTLFITGAIERKRRR